MPSSKFPFFLTCFGVLFVQNTDAEKSNVRHKGRERKVKGNWKNLRDEKAAVSAKMMNKVMWVGIIMEGLRLACSCWMI